MTGRGWSRVPVRVLGGIGLLLAVLGSACAGEEEVPTREAKPGARPGGEIVVGITEPRTIDPSATSALDAAGSAVVGAMCDTLVAFDPLTGEPKPAIAESWQVSSGGERLTVNLREGVRFHNGEELVADDVVFTLSRIADRDFASPVSSLLESVRGYGEVHGDVEAEAERFRRELRGVRVITNFSFEVLLSGDRSTFFRVLGHPATAPVPRAAVEDDPEAFARRPICAGPYAAAEPWSPGDGAIELRRFEGYYAGNTAFTSGGAGYPDALSFRIFPDRDAQVAAFEAGELDVAQVPAGALGEEDRFGGALHVAPTPTLEFIGLPTNEPPYDRPGTRIALSQALDRQGIADAVYEGARAPSRGVYPPALGELHREDACLDHAPLRSDLESARESLAGAGADLRGESVSLYFNDEFGHRELASAVARSWEAAFGAEVRLVGMPWDRYRLRGMREGFDGPFRLSWRAEYPSPDRYMAPLFAEGAIGRDNWMRFSSTEFEDVLEDEARKAANAEDRADAYLALENIVCGRMPVIPVAYGATGSLIRGGRIDSAVERHADVTTGGPLLRELYVRG